MRNSCPRRTEPVKQGFVASPLIRLLHLKLPIVEVHAVGFLTAFYKGKHPLRCTGKGMLLTFYAAACSPRGSQRVKTGSDAKDEEDMRTSADWDAGHHIVAGHSHPHRRRRRRHVVPPLLPFVIHLLHHHSHRHHRLHSSSRVA